MPAAARWVWKRYRVMRPRQRYWKWIAPYRSSCKNLATLKANNARVVNTNTLAFLSQPGTPHHVVFVDPPFRKGLLEETLQLLETQGWLADDALIYVESEVENGLPPVPANWALYREKVAGQVAYRLYQRDAQGENDVD